MTSLARGYPFGLINLLDASNTAGPMLLEPSNVAALASCCIAVFIGVLGLMKTPRGAVSYTHLTLPTILLV